MQKKETFFTCDTLHSKARAILEDLRPYRRARPVLLVPEHSALLVLDMQRFFLESSSHAYVGSAPAIIPGIKSMIRAYAERDLPIVFTRHLNTVQDARLMATWWRDLITGENSLSEITADLDVCAGTVIQKSQYDAFYGTALNDLLHRRSVTQVVVCGVMTHLCCESTARSAFMQGFEVFFTVDGTATYNEVFHRAALTNLAHGFATLVLVSDILRMLRGEDDD
jgi:bifunctional isochorismate lyase/aryl carrier protein